MPLFANEVRNGPASSDKYHSTANQAAMCMVLCLPISLSHILLALNLPSKQIVQTENMQQK